MGILNKITDGALKSNILDDTKGTGPNPSLLTPILVPAGLQQLSTDPSPKVYDTITEMDLTKLNGPIDKRVSANTGKLIHNWWVYYLKSLKKFLTETFDDSINNFEFNYANKSVLLKKLYKQMDVQNPSCIMNLTSFRTDSNLDPKRRNSGFYNLEQTTILAKNISKSLEVRVDFKFVNLTQSITINFDDATDVLNYYDRFTTIFPLNKDFINYEYKTLINIHEETEGWDLLDETDGLIYDASILGSDNLAGLNKTKRYTPPQRWAQYICCPQFTLVGINQNIDKQNQKYSLQIDLNTLLRVPQTIITRMADEARIRAIQVVMDIGSTTKQEAQPKQENSIDTELNNHVNFTSLDKPICIDIDRDIYQDYRMENMLYLSPRINFNLVDGTLLLPVYLEEILINKAAALYIIEDSTTNNPELYWFELGYIYKSSSITNAPEDDNLNNSYSIVKRTDTYLRSIGVDLGFGWKADMNTDEPIVEMLEIKLKKFERMAPILDNAGSWFDARLFLFNIGDLDLLD